MSDYSKANWTKFQNLLEQIDVNDMLISNDVDEINEFIINNVNKVAIESIPPENNKKRFHIKIPQYLRTVVDHKKYLLKSKLENNSNKDLNKLTKMINVLRSRKSMYYETIIG